MSAKWQSVSNKVGSIKINTRDVDTILQEVAISVSELYNKNGPIENKYPQKVAVELTLTDNNKLNIILTNNNSGFPNYSVEFPSTSSKITPIIKRSDFFTGPIVEDTVEYTENSDIKRESLKLTPEQQLDLITPRRNEIIKENLDFYTDGDSEDPKSLFRTRRQVERDKIGLKNIDNTEKYLITNNILGDDITADVTDVAEFKAKQESIDIIQKMSNKERRLVRTELNKYSENKFGDFEKWYNNKRDFNECDTSVNIDMHSFENLNMFEKLKFKSQYKDELEEFKKDNKLDFSSVTDLLNGKDIVYSKEIYDDIFKVLKTKSDDVDNNEMYETNFQISKKIDPVVIDEIPTLEENIYSNYKESTLSDRIGDDVLYDFTRLNNVVHESVYASNISTIDTGGRRFIAYRNTTDFTSVNNGDFIIDPSKIQHEGNRLFNKNVIQIESDGKFDALSYTGALGLGQITRDALIDGLRYLDLHDDYKDKFFAGGVSNWARTQGFNMNSKSTIADLQVISDAYREAFPEDPRFDPEMSVKLKASIYDLKRRDLNTFGYDDEYINSNPWLLYAAYNIGAAGIHNVIQVADGTTSEFSSSAKRALIPQRGLFNDKLPAKKGAQGYLSNVKRRIGDTPINMNTLFDDVVSTISYNESVNKTTNIVTNNTPKVEVSPPEKVEVKRTDEHNKMYENTFPEIKFDMSPSTWNTREFNMMDEIVGTTNVLDTNVVYEQRNVSFNDVEVKPSFISNIGSVIKNLSPISVAHAAEVNIPQQEFTMTKDNSNPVGYHVGSYQRDNSFKNIDSRVLVYSDVITKHANDNNVPPRVVAAIIQQESRGNPNAVSGAGAQGLMQLMPATAKWLGVSNPFDPEQNIEAGVRYFASLYKRYNNDISLAMAAYNAGPGNVRRYGGIPPFKETIDYVSKNLEVIENWQ